MKTNRYSNPTKDLCCPKCNSTNHIGEIPNFICINCGEKFQSYSTKNERELSFRKKGVDREISSQKKSKYISSDCPTLCPKCQSQNITKKEQYCLCNSCKYFGKIESFEAV